MSHYTDQNRISDKAWLNSVLGQMGLQKSSNKNHEEINEDDEVPFKAAAPVHLADPTAEYKETGLTSLIKRLELVSQMLARLAKAFNSTNPAVGELINKLEEELKAVRQGIAKVNFILKQQGQL